MSIIAAYEMSYCPLLLMPSDEIELRRQKNQEMLWETAKWFCVNEQRTPFELCYIAKPRSQSVHVFLLIYSTGQDSDETRQNELLHAFERLLPGDYGWERYSSNEGKKTFADSKALFDSVMSDRESGEDAACPSSCDWHTSTLRRKFHLFNLSPKLLAGLFSQQSPIKDDMEDGSVFASPPEPDLSTQFTKQFPGIIPGEFKGQLLLNPVSLPYHPAIRREFGDERVFFQELLHAAPAIISLRIFPPLKGQWLEEIYGLATFARRILEPYHTLMNPDNTIPYSEVEEFYTGYLGTSNQLFSFEISAIGKDFVRTKGLALALTVALGGLRNFEVSAPTRGFSQQRVDETEFLKQFSDQYVAIESCKAWKPLIRIAPYIVNQEEAKELFRLPVGTEQGIPGIEVRQPPPFATSTTNLEREDEHREGYIKLGEIKTSKVSSDTSSFYHSIPIQQLCKHALIVGSTGSGKTTTVHFLLKQIADAGISFIVIEPSMKAEYYDKLKDYESLRDGKLKRITLNDLRFDPLRLPVGITVEQHVSYLKSCFQAAFPLTDVAAMFLETCLLKYYNEYLDSWKIDGQIIGRLWIHGVDKDKYVVPSFDHFRSVFEKYMLEMFPHMKDPQKRFSADNWIDALDRRLENLSAGVLGKVFQRADEENRKNASYNCFSEYLKSPAVIELNKVPDREQQSLLMAFFLTLLFEVRQVQGLSSIKHVLVIEEAHRLLGKSTTSRSSDTAGESASEKAATMFADMLAEIRAFGQSVFIAEQIPSKIIPDAVKNTNLKYLMRLTSKEDREFMGESMNCSESQQQFVNTLRPGQAVVFEEELNQPVLLTTPYPDKKS